MFPAAWRHTPGDELYLLLRFVFHKNLRPFHNSLAIPTILHRSENWTLNKKYNNTITTAEVKCMKCTANYTWKHYNRYEDVLTELKIF